MQENQLSHFFSSNAAAASAAAVATMLSILYSSRQQVLSPFKRKWKYNSKKSTQTAQKRARKITRQQHD
jgi:hypothetical protein